MNELVNTKVSLIIPAYNAGQYIGRALESVENQTQPPDEVIVIDDGSTDETASRVREFAIRSKLSVFFEQQQNKGPGAARNRGIKKSSGDLIVFLDADDVIYPGFLDQVTRALNRHTHWIACFSDRDVVDKHGNLISKDLDHPTFQSIRTVHLDGDLVELSDEMLFSKMLPGSVIPMTIACRRTDVEAVAGFDDDILLGQDKLFMLKLIKRGTFGYVNRSLGVWQKHDSNLTHASNALRRFPYTDLGLQLILDSRDTLGLTVHELAEIGRNRAKLATQWIYAASNKPSIETFPLGYRLVSQHRISIGCFAKAILRYLCRYVLR